MDEHMMLDAGTQETVGTADTETRGPVVGSAMSDEFKNLHEAGDGDPQLGTEDGGAEVDDIASPETPFDADAVQLEQMRQMARGFNVPEQVVSSFENSGQAQAYLLGMRSAMAQPQQPQPDTGAPKPAALPLLDFEADPNWEGPLAGAFGKVREYGAGINQRLGQYDQQTQMIIGALRELDANQQRTARMQQSVMLDAGLSSLDPEVKAMFESPAAKGVLEANMRTLEAGRQAMGQPEATFNELFTGAVAMAAFGKTKTIERDRLAAKQKKKARGATPKPSGAKTTDRELDSDQVAQNAMLEQQARLAARFGG
jgi:hypothetical protein